MSYAVMKGEDGGTFEVKTPGRGFSLIRGLDEQAAHNIARVINQAYDNGGADARQGIKDALGIEDCNCAHE